MPEEYTKDLFTQELDELHDIRLAIVELLKFFAGKEFVTNLPFKNDPNETKQ